MPANMPQMQQGFQAQNNNQQMQRHIIGMLQGQGQFSGWQATVTVEQRAMKIKLLIDSLRLIQPVIELPKAVQVALSFEQKAFTQSPTQEAYLGMCNEKLRQIQETRQQQVNNANAQNNQTQNNALFQMQQMQQMGQNLSFPPQLQHPMQASPLPGQQQQQQQEQQPNPMNMNQSINPNMAMQQPGMQPNANFIQNQQQRQNQQPGGIRWSKEDNEAINKLAAQMAEQTPPADIAKIRANLDNMSAQQREQMASKNVEPLLFFFRTQASKEYRRQKMASMAANNSADGASGILNNGLQGQGQRQTPAGMQGGQGKLGMPSNVQASNTPFISNIDHFQGQQADGLRSQEAGQLVVPASNTQGMTPDQFRLQQQMLQRQQLLGQQNAGQGANQNFLAQQQQQMQHAQQTQQERLQNAAQFQAQSQAQARSQAAARAQFNAQNQSGLQGMPQNPSMTMLTRGVDPNVQGGTAQVPRPPSRAPMPGQQMPEQQQQPGTQMLPGPQQGMNPQAGQGPRPGGNQMSQLPPQLQQLLRSQPQTEWKRIINEFQHNPTIRRNILQQAPNMQQAMSQPGQVPRTQDGQFLGGSTIAPPMQQSLSAGPIPVQGQPQNMTPNPQMMLQQRQRQQQQQNQEMIRQRQLQMQIQMQQGSVSQQQQINGVQPLPQGGFYMTNQQMAFMDRQAFPQHIHNVLSRNPSFPQQVKVWGQLKQWLHQNPLPQLPIEKVLELQRNSFEQFLRNAQTRTANEQNGQAQIPIPNMAQPMAMPQTQLTQPGMPQAQPGQPGQPGQGQVNTMPANVLSNMGPIPKAAIARARMVNPQLKDMPEPQLVALLTQQREKQMRQKMAHMAQMNSQTQTQQNPFLPLPPNGIQNQPQQAAQPLARQPSNQGMVQIPISAPGQQSQQFSAVSRPQSTKIGAQTLQQQHPGVAQAGSKGTKRTNDDDVVEIPNPVAVPQQQQQQQQQQQRPQSGQQGIGKVMPPMTQDILDKMSPAQRQQYDKLRMQNHHQQLNQRLADLAKEAQNGMAKPVPLDLDGASRTRIMKVLTSPDTKSMLGRFDQLLVTYLIVTQSDTAVRQLITQVSQHLSSRPDLY